MSFSDIKLSIYKISLDFYLASDINEGKWRNHLLENVKKDTLCDQHHSKCESVKLNFDSWSLNYVFGILRTTCLKFVVSADVKTDVYKKN